MALIDALILFVVGLVSGTVVRWFAGLAAIVALVLGVTTPEIDIVNQLIEEYYPGNELLFISGSLFGIDADQTKEIVERRE